MVNPLKCAPLWARDHIIAYCPLWAVPLEAHTIFSAWLDSITVKAEFKY